MRNKRYKWYQNERFTSVYHTRRHIQWFIHLTYLKKLTILNFDATMLGMIFRSVHMSSNPSIVRKAKNLFDAVSEISISSLRHSIFLHFFIRTTFFSVGEHFLHLEVDSIFFVSGERFKIFGKQTHLLTNPPPYRNHRFPSLKTHSCRS